MIKLTVFARSASYLEKLVKRQRYSIESLVAVQNDKKYSIPVFLKIKMSSFGSLKRIDHKSTKRWFTPGPRNLPHEKQWCRLCLNASADCVLGLPIEKNKTNFAPEVVLSLINFVEL